MSNFILKSFGISTGNLSRSTCRSPQSNTMSARAYVAMQTRRKSSISIRVIQRSRPSSEPIAHQPPPPQRTAPPTPWHSTLNITCHFQDPNSSQSTQNSEVTNGVATTQTVQKIFGWQATTVISFTTHEDQLVFSGATATHYKLGYLYSGTSQDQLPQQRCVKGHNTITIAGNLVGSQNNKLNPMSKKLSYTTEAKLTVGGEMFQYSVKFVICEADQ